MLLRFSIKNYLSIKDKVVLDMVATKNEKHFDFFCQQVGDYKVLKLAMLFGPNASGKTNILYALNTVKEIILDDKLNKDSEINSIPFEFDKKTKNADSEFVIDFLINEQKYSYEIHFNSNFVSYEKLVIYNPSKQMIYKRETAYSDEVNLKFGTYWKIKASDEEVIANNTTHNMTILSGYNKTSIKFVELTNVRNWFSSYLKQTITPKTQLQEYVKKNLFDKTVKKEHLVEMLKRADFNITNTTIEEKILSKEDLNSTQGNQREILNFLLEHTDNNEKLSALKMEFKHNVTVDGKSVEGNLPSGLESLGTLRYFGLSGVFLKNINSSFSMFIDELDSSMHPDLMIHFINSFMLNTTKSQLIFTTHYLPLLEDTDELRKDVVWFTEKREDGSTDLYSLKDIEIRSALNYYKAYKVGKLGAKPFIGSAYLNILNEEG